MRLVPHIPAGSAGDWLAIKFAWLRSLLARKRQPERKLATRSDMQRLVEHFNKRST